MSSKLTDERDTTEGRAGRNRMVWLSVLAVVAVAVVVALIVLSGGGGGGGT